eukprot:scaffold656_cov403-Pavlova_lutheri.AAC.29
MDIAPNGMQSLMRMDRREGDLLTSISFPASNDKEFVRVTAYATMYNMATVFTPRLPKPTSAPVLSTHWKTTSTARAKANRTCVGSTFNAKQKTSRTTTAMVNHPFHETVMKAVANKPSMARPMPRSAKRASDRACCFAFVAVQSNASRTESLAVVHILPTGPFVAAMSPTAAFPRAHPSVSVTLELASGHFAPTAAFQFRDARVPLLDSIRHIEPVSTI